MDRREPEFEKVIPFAHGELLSGCKMIKRRVARERSRRFLAFDEAEQAGAEELQPLGHGFGAFGVQ